MSLRNRRFERNVRSLARTRLRESRSLWDEYRRSRSRWFRVNSLTQRAAFLMILGLAAGVLSQRNREYAAFALAVYGIGSMLLRRQQWGSLMEGLDHNYFYLHHPFSDRTIFLEHMKSMVLSTAWSVVVFATGLVFLVHVGNAWAWAAIPALALAMGVASFGGLLLLVRFLPNLPAITAVVVVVAYGVVLFAASYLQGLVPTIQRVLMLTPVGSIVFFVAEYAIHHSTVPLALVPAAASVAVVPWLHRRITASYSTRPLLEGLTLADEPDQGEETTQSSDRDTMPAVLAERIVQDTWTARSPRVRPWLDAFIHRKLSKRDSVVCRLLCGTEETYWTQWWIRGAKLAMIPVALMFVPGYAPEWLLLLTAAIAVLSGGPLFGGTWAGFSDVWSSSKLAPFYAAFPVGFRDIARVLLKVNTIRLLAWAPGILIIFIGAGSALEGEPTRSIAYGLQFLFVAICVQPFMVIAKFSKGSNDSRTWRISAVIVILGVLALGLLFLGLASALFIVGGYVKLGFALSLPIVSALSLGLYRVGYDHSLWDLLHEP